MLYQLGAVQFEVQPLNAVETGTDSEGGWTEKPVLGRRPPLEWVGDGAERLRITAKLFPATFGGLGSYDDLVAMRQSGSAQYLMRGDGVPLGWVVVERLSRRDSYLAADGVGKVIDLDIDLRRTDAPAAADFFAAIESLLP